MDNNGDEIENIYKDADENIENGIADFEEEKESLITRLKKKQGMWGVLAGILVVLLKFKTIIFLLLTKLKFLFVLLKLSKFVSTFGSMLLMIYVYAQMYGWAFGVGFVTLLLIHEMGHYLTAKKVKLDVSLPLFIPFVGALISMKEEPESAVVEAKIAAGGPLLGSLGALICLIFSYIFKEEFFIALAYTGFMLNLFNLIPLHPLDGGRIVSAISPKMWLIGIPIGIIALFKFFNPIILFMLVLGVIQVYKQYKNPDKSYYEVKAYERAIFAIIYFGLILLLGIGITSIHGVTI